MFYQPLFNFPTLHLRPSTAPNVAYTAKPTTSAYNPFRPLSTKFRLRFQDAEGKLFISIRDDFLFWEEGTESRGKQTWIIEDDGSFSNANNPDYFITSHGLDTTPEPLTIQAEIDLGRLDGPIPGFWVIENSAGQWMTEEFKFVRDRKRAVKLQVWPY
jgi:hypothetical protein